MAHKPSHVGDRSKFIGSLGIGLPSPRGISLPRWHFAGEAPPELSPLDAFAAQSRLLARQLEESAHGENRMSRLPPLTVTNSLAPARPGYLRSTSADPLTPTTPSRHKTYFQDDLSPRPTSIHPPLYNPNEAENVVLHTTHNYFTSQNGDQPKDRRSSSAIQTNDHVQRDVSPPRIYDNRRSYELDQEQLSLHSQHQPSIDSLNQRKQNCTSTSDSQIVSERKSLARSRSPLIRRPSSHRPPSTDGSDDDSSTISRPTALHERKESGDCHSTNHASPRDHSLHRTSSISSDASFCVTGLVTSPPFNFSRPLSRASVNLSVPDLNSPPLNTSSDSSPVIKTDDIRRTTISIKNTEKSAAPTYVYSKFSLPRGKMLQRNSIIFLDSPPANPLSPEINGYYSSAPSPCSPFTRASNSPLKQDSQTGYMIASPPLDVPRPSFNSSSSSRSSTDPGRVSPSRPLSKGDDIRPLQRPTTSSMESTSTIKARSPQSLTSPAEFSADEHVDKAIQYHNAGKLNKSTYHLRLAARMGHSTGMLLYALACRHGWGMRRSPREGVAWLRRAVDEVGVVVADDENMMKAGKKIDYVEAKAKKAQFALGIYELGVSHMNGWGIEQDKALALRCFEIAGAWGDTDAMSEAGFCYAQGIGCKKDLKKSAKFYRMAEAKGVNMIGNSWIYKAKYNDEAPLDVETDGRGRSNTASSKSTTASTDKRHKSRTRGIFGRSKAAHT
ncbi:hypothetical protein K3495_g10008 [Podosphaera aphanis]|nr:hypothetical protein K3495_g10008 [Podosphaera aphanis]